MNPVKIALVDDHHLLRAGLAELINGFAGYRVTLEAGNGRELTERLDPANLPDVALLDINMPHMDGFATAEWLRANHPSVKVLALSMDDHESSIIRILRAGACGYVLKDAETSEFRTALDMLVARGFYYSDLVTGAMMANLNGTVPGGKGPNGHGGDQNGLSAREIDFLKLCCSHLELTYKEIADKMCLSVRTIDGYREDLFRKLGVRSKSGLVLYAIRAGLVKLDGGDQ